MRDIYGQDDPMVRNSIVDIPEGYAESAGNTLYSWLGSIWRSVHKGEGMIRGLQGARGIRLAQLYLDILEAAKLQDRNGAPVFHRELWHPISVRRSQRNRAQENMLSIGGEGVIGAQPEGSVYGEGTVLQMGLMANHADYVTYPIGGNIVGMASSIVDNIINPTVVLNADTGDGGDFAFRNNTIIFRESDDPLADGSPFERYDIPGESDDPEDADMEAILWASDVLFDKNYIADHLSYPLGLSAPSSAIVKRIINAAWSSVASGLTPELIRTLMAAMLNIPVIQNERETVVSITETDDAKEVETDMGMYRVCKRATLVKGLHPGSVLSRGDLLDESLRVYPYLNLLREETPSVRSDSGSGSESGGGSSGPVAEPEYATGFSVPLKMDIPSVILPPDILRVRTEYGVYAMWGTTRVKRDPSGSGRLYFDVGGTDGDREAFWKGVWESAEKAGVSMESLIGQEGSEISPAEFMLRNLVGANTIFAVIDRSQLENPSLMRDPMFFGTLTSVVPSAIRLFLVEHQPVGKDDRMDLGSSMERALVSASAPAVVETFDAVALPGLEGRGASYGDRVGFRFVRPAPAKKRAVRE